MFRSTYGLTYLVFNCIYAIPLFSLLWALDFNHHASLWHHLPYFLVAVSTLAAAITLIAFPPSEKKSIQQEQLYLFTFYLLFAFYSFIEAYELVNPKQHLISFSVGIASSGISLASLWLLRQQFLAHKALQTSLVVANILSMFTLLNWQLLEQFYALAPVFVLAGILLAFVGIFTLWQLTKGPFAPVENKNLLVHLLTVQLASILYLFSFLFPVLLYLSLAIYVTAFSSQAISHIRQYRQEHSTPPSRFFTVASVICAALILPVALAALVGWYTKNDYLIVITQGFSPMSFDTAQSLFLCSLAILYAHLSFRFFPLVTILFVLFLSCKTIVLLLVGGNPEALQHLLFPKHVPDSLPYQLMSLPTALCALLSSTAFLLWMRGAIKLSFLCTIIVLTLSLSTLYGYLLHVEPLIFGVSLLGMAIHTTASFFLLGISLATLTLQNATQKTKNFFWKSSPLYFFLLGSLLTFLGWLSLTNQELPRSTLVPWLEVITGLLFTLLLSSLFYFLSRRYIRAVEEVQSTTRTLQKRQKDFETIFNTVPVIIYYKDTHNNIINCNKKAAETLGLEPEDLEGKPTKAFFPEHAEKYYLDDLKVIRSGIASRNIIEPYKTPTGETRFVKTDKMPSFDEQGQVDGIVAIAVDVTELIQMQKKLEDSIAKAEKASRSKSKFLSKFSHEIRTPLNGIIGLADLLRHHLEDSKQQERIDKITKSAQQLLKILANIIDLAELDTEDVLIAKAPVDLLQLFQDVFSSFQMIAEEKEVNLQLLLPETLPTLQTDPVFIKKILHHLLDNAIRFNPGADVLLILEKTGQSENTIHVRFEVKDTGQGLNEQEKEAVFEELFDRIYITEKQGGLGLGLGICFLITRFLGGGINLLSEPGMGTTVSVTLSLEVFNATQAKQE